MRSLALFLIIALISLPALAFPPDMFVGGSLEINVPTGDFPDKDFIHQGGGAKLGTGGQVDVGFTNDIGSAYLGYRMCQYSAKTDTNAIMHTRAEKWTVDRAVIGARWHVFGTRPYSITPTLGGGLTLGKPKLDMKDLSTGATSSKSAKTSLGYFLEAGALLHEPNSSLSVIANLQYHMYDADFGSGNHGKFNVSFLSIQAGIRYSFPVF
jgi:hypothetical protein